MLYNVFSNSGDWDADSIGFICTVEVSDTIKREEMLRLIADGRVEEMDIEVTFYPVAQQSIINDEELNVYGEFCMESSSMLTVNFGEDQCPTIYIMCPAEPMYTL